MNSVIIRVKQLVQKLVRLTDQRLQPWTKTLLLCHTVAVVWYLSSRDSATHIATTNCKVRNSFDKFF